MIQVPDPALTRRGFLGGTAATFATTLLPSRGAAQTARYRRFDISDPNMPPRVLESYKKAIREMLRLDPADARNWYRNASVHVLDCPHGNWWFLPWHRAYIGWFERICRKLSGDQDFALPYWDWTKTPRVPAALFDGVLDPNDTAFIASFGNFKQRFEPTMSALWPQFTPAQMAVLTPRGYGSPEDFWDTAAGSFFNRPRARGLTSGNPNLDPLTQTTVAIRMIRSALRASKFAEDPGSDDPAGFASDKTQSHNENVRQGILESQPHNNVHGAVATPEGFMRAYLSPVDPIFFLHHANLDRLWDVWTRRQTALQRPTLPEGAELAAWSREPFLFFADEAGQPLSSRTSAGDYVSMSAFDYDYAPGSGEDEVPTVTVGRSVPVPAMQTFNARVTSFPTGDVATGVLDVPADLLQPEAPDSPTAVAEVTLDLDHADQGRRFRVLLTPSQGATPIEAGAITVFGHPMGPTTFSVPLPENIPSGNARATLDIKVEPLEGPAAPPESGPARSEARPLVTAIKVSFPAQE